MKISIDIDEMINKIDIIEKIADDLQTNMQNIEQLIMDLGFDWQGKAELAYTAKILYIKKQFNSMYDFIIDYSIALKGIVNDYKVLESTIENQLEA